MSVSAQMRTAAIWGICAIAAQIVFLTIQGVLQGSFSPMFKFFWFELAVFLTALSFTIHMWGYSHLGQKVQNVWLVFSAQGLAFFFAVIGGFVMVAGVMNGFFAGSGIHLLNGIQGIVFILFCIPALTFVISLISTYKRVGILSVLSVGVVVFPVAMAIPWLLILFLIPSVILLFRESKY